MKRGFVVQVEVEWEVGERYFWRIQDIQGLVVSGE